MRHCMAVAVLCVACVAIAGPQRAFTFGEGSFVAIQDSPSSMPRRLFPTLSDAEFVALSGGATACSSINAFFLRREGRDILVDAGNGGTRGVLLATLKDLGTQPEDVDDILLTHLHGDHIGGLLDASGAAVFPNATLHVSALERDYWLARPGQNGDLARKVFSAYAGRVRAFDFGDSPIPGITALDATGHTPGHAAFETEAFIVVGDLLHASSIQVPRPEVPSVYDIDPAKASAMRLCFYLRAAASGKPIAGAHLPWPGIGKIIKDEAGFRYEPLP